MLANEISVASNQLTNLSDDHAYVESSQNILQKVVLELTNNMDLNLITFSDLSTKIVSCLQEDKRDFFYFLEYFMFGEEPEPFKKRLSELDKRSQFCSRVIARHESSYFCRDCERDQYTVLCSECFHQSQHVNHNYKVSLSSGGGSCDCGDLDSWNQHHACSIHDGSFQSDFKFDETVARRIASIFSILKDLMVRVFSDQSFSLPAFITPRSPIHVLLVFNDEVNTYSGVNQFLTDTCGLKKEESLIMTTIIDQRGFACVTSGDLPVLKEIVEANSVTDTQNLMMKIVPFDYFVYLALIPEVMNWIYDLSYCSQSINNIFVKEFIPMESFKDVIIPHLPIRELLLNFNNMWKSARSAFTTHLLNSIFLSISGRLNFAALYLHCQHQIYKMQFSDDHDSNYSIVSVSTQFLTRKSIMLTLMEHYSPLSVTLNYIAVLLTKPSNLALRDLSKLFSIMNDATEMLTIDLTGASKKIIRKLATKDMIILLRLFHLFEGDEPLSKSLEMSLPIRILTHKIVAEVVKVLLKISGLIIKWILSDDILFKTTFLMTIHTIIRPINQIPRYDVNIVNHERSLAQDIYERVQQNRDCSKYLVSTDSEDKSSPFSTSIWMVTRFINHLMLTTVTSGREPLINFMMECILQSSFLLTSFNTVHQCMVKFKDTTDGPPRYSINTEFYGIQCSYYTVGQKNLDFRTIQWFLSSLKCDKIVETLLHQFSLDDVILFSTNISRSQNSYVAEGVTISLPASPDSEDSSCTSICDRIISMFSHLIYLYTNRMEEYTCGESFENIVKYNLIHHIFAQPSAVQGGFKKSICYETRLDVPMIHEVIGNVLPTLADRKLPTSLSSGTYLLKPEYYKFLNKYFCSFNSQFKFELIEAFKRIPYQTSQFYEFFNYLPEFSPHMKGIQHLLLNYQVQKLVLHIFNQFSHNSNQIVNYQTLFDMCLHLLICFLVDLVRFPIQDHPDSGLQYTINHFRETDFAKNILTYLKKSIQCHLDEYGADHLRCLCIQILEHGNINILSRELKLSSKTLENPSKCLKSPSEHLTSLKTTAFTASPPLSVRDGDKYLGLLFHDNSSDNTIVNKKTFNCLICRCDEELEVKDAHDSGFWPKLDSSDSDLNKTNFLKKCEQENDWKLVYICHIGLSRILSDQAKTLSHENYSMFDYDFALNTSMNQQKELYISGCGHAFHKQCIKYGLKSQTNSSVTRLEDLKFECPCCKFTGNCLVPVYPTFSPNPHHENYKNNLNMNESLVSFMEHANQTRAVNENQFLSCKKMVNQIFKQSSDLNQSRKYRSPTVSASGMLEEIQDYAEMMFDSLENTFQEDISDPNLFLVDSLDQIITMPSLDGDDVDDDEDDEEIQNTEYVTEVSRYMRPESLLDTRTDNSFLTRSSNMLTEILYHSSNSNSRLNIETFINERVENCFNSILLTYWRNETFDDHPPNSHHEDLINFFRIYSSAINMSSCICQVLEKDILADVEHANNASGSNTYITFLSQFHSIRSINRYAVHCSILRHCRLSCGLLQFHYKKILLSNEMHSMMSHLCIMKNLLKVTINELFSHDASGSSVLKYDCLPKVDIFKWMVKYYFVSNAFDIGAWYYSSQVNSESDHISQNILTETLHVADGHEYFLLRLSFVLRWIQALHYLPSNHPKYTSMLLDDTTTIGSDDMELTQEQLELRNNLVSIMESVSHLKRFKTSLNNSRNFFYALKCVISFLRNSLIFFDSFVESNIFSSIDLHKLTHISSNIWNEYVILTQTLSLPTLLFDSQVFSTVIKMTTKCSPKRSQESDPIFVEAHHRLSCTIPKLIDLKDSAHDIILKNTPLCHRTNKPGDQPVLCLICGHSFCSCEICRSDPSTSYLSSHNKLCACENGIFLDCLRLDVVVSSEASHQSQVFSNIFIDQHGNLPSNNNGRNYSQYYAFPERYFLLNRAWRRNMNFNMIRTKSLC